MVFNCPEGQSLPSCPCPYSCSMWSVWSVCTAHDTILCDCKISITDRLASPFAIRVRTLYFAFCILPVKSDWRATGINAISGFYRNLCISMVISLTALVSSSASTMCGYTPPNSERHYSINNNTNCFSHLVLQRTRWTLDIVHYYAASEKNKTNWKKPTQIKKLCTCSGKSIFPTTNLYCHCANRTVKET